MLKSSLSFLLDAINRTLEIDGVEHAGYMSFMVLLSFFPFLVFFLSLTSTFGDSSLGVYLVQIIVDHVPDNSNKHIIVEALQEMAESPPKKLLTLAIIGSIWSASSFVEGLRTILNRIYHVHYPPAYFIRRLLSIVQFLLLTVALYAVIMSLVIIPAAINKVTIIAAFMSGLNPFWIYIRYFLIIISLFFTVSMIYYMIPNVKIRYYEVFPGSIITVFLWVIGGYLLGQYIHHSDLSIIYGSLWNIMVTLIFFYIISMIFIYGAVVNSMLFGGARLRKYN